MKTIAIISQKGGSGKTTLTLGLAGAAIAVDGLSVAIADGDRQRSICEWYNQRKALAAKEPSFALPFVQPVTPDHHGLGGFQETCRRNGADLLFVDTSPNSTDETLNVAELADLLIVPCVPSFVDLRALKRTRDIVKLAEKPALAVVNLAKHFGTEASATGQTLEQAHQFQVCPHFVRDLIAFKRAYAADQTVFEYDPGGDAAADMQRVYMFACGQLNMSTRSPDSSKVAVNG